MGVMEQGIDFTPFTSLKSRLSMDHGPLKHLKKPLWEHGATWTPQTYRFPP